MPMRQRLHWPQPAWISTVTRSPMANSSTPGPSAATVPMYSWPGVQFLLKGRPPCTSAGGPERDDVEVGGADRHRIDAHQHLGRARHRHRLLDELEFAGIAQHPGAHPAPGWENSGSVLTPAGAYMEAPPARDREPLGALRPPPARRTPSGTGSGGVGAVEELNGREQEIRVADVLDAVQHVFARRRSSGAWYRRGSGWSR